MSTIGRPGRSTNSIIISAAISGVTGLAINAKDTKEIEMVRVDPSNRRSLWIGVHSPAKGTCVSRFYLSLIAGDSTGLKDNKRVLASRFARIRCSLTQFADR